MSKSILNQLSKTLYNSARVTRDLKAVSSGKPSKIAKRGCNKVVGRLFGKLWWR